MTQDKARIADLEVEVARLTDKLVIALKVLRWIADDMLAYPCQRAREALADIEKLK